MNWQVMKLKAWIILNTFIKGASVKKNRDSLK